jgi:hypothetical protein
VYVCEHCNTIVSPNIPSYLLPVKVRPKQYPLRSEANEYTDPVSGRRKKSHDPGGQGLEIVRELRVCHSCFEQATTPQLE